MGFDNECILNIQSLAGEYFCPVCRLLVYPNEALQSQCTHLYCKPCLTYVVNTTRACPYDGYLVTEADSKLLIESNKTLAETIGKVAVHCLYHRSGCIWQGSLSECVGHCSGCAFGNSPVVCNRCGIQIVHRQVQEHAQTCQGVQPQAQHVQGSQGNSATTMEAAANYSQSAGIATSLTQTSQPVSSTPDPKQQVGSSLQGQAAVPTPEQWYQQQQQQYQQYYQQYPGYDLQQQNYQQYYPYQQPAGLQYEPPQNPQVQPQAYVQTQLQSQPQSHPQAQSQTQLQPQSQSLPQPSLHSQAPTHIQTPAAAQPQNQGLVNAPQQLYPAMQPVPSQMQSQPHPANHIHPNPQPQSYPQAQPQQQPVPMTQYQQPQPQMQHPPAQIQQQGNSQFHAHQPPAAQSQAHSQAQAHYHPHALIPQHNQPLNSNVHSQMQNPPVHGVTGHHSYPHSQAHQQTHLGASQNPIQMQGQFPQQLPISRPPLSHATYASQQQLPWLPSAGVVQNASAIQQQSAPAHAQQPAQHVNQRPVMQAVQCPPLQQQHPFGQQGQFLQQQLPIPSQLRSQGPSGSFPKHPNGHPHMQQQNIASIQQNQPQNSVGKHMIPNHGAQSHPYPQSRAGGQVRTVHHHANQPPANQGNSLLINNRVVNPEQQASESSSQKASKKVEGNLDAISGQGADGGVINILKIEADPPLDNKNNSTAGGENGKPLTKQIGVKEEAAESTFESSNGSKLGEVKAEDKKDFSSIEPKQMKQLGNENKEIQDGSLPKNAQPQGTELSEDQSKELQKDLGGVLPPPTGSDDGSQVISTTSGSILGSPHDAKRKLLSQHGSDSSGFVQHSHWPPPHYNGPPTLQQRPIGTSTLQGPPIGSLHHVQMPGNPSVQFMPPASGPVTHPGQPLHPLGGMPEPGSAASFGRGPGHYGPPPQGFGQQLLAQGSHGQGQAPTSHGASKMSQGDPVGGQPFATAPPGVFDSHGQMIVTGTPHEGHTAVQCPIHPREVEMFPHQRPGPPHVSGVHANTMKMNGAQGPDPSLAFGLRNDRLNPFPADPARRPFNRSEFEDNLKKFPRPSLMEAETIPKVGSYSLSSLDRGVRGPTYDTGLNPDSFSGYASSRIFAPLQMGGPFHPADVERPLGFRDDAAARSGPVLSNPDFRGLGPGYGRHLMDGFGTRSPHDYHENAPRRFGEHPGISGLDEIDGRGFHRFGDPPVNSFQESRFSIFSSSLHRTDFEGPGNWRMGEHMRSGDFIGQDRNFGPRNLPGRLHIGEGAGYGAHTSHGRVGELAGLGSIDQFGGGNRSSHPRLGEPGFRSSFYLRGFPDGGRVYTGDRDSFDNSRKKKSASMGWCRICKVDCETVEGLDLHSQTKEHQKMAMDIVQSIKQNAKKQKLTSNDNSSLEDPSKSKDVDIEGHGKKE